MIRRLRLGKRPPYSPLKAPSAPGRSGHGLPIRSASEGTVHVHRLWKRFRADRVKFELKDRLRYVREHGLASRWRWALRDVSFHLEPGSAVGLIGANGSGKSTLLKVLTRVIDPYAGEVAVAGRVGALIEVEAGIHKELTGRENVYLYGSLLGLRRQEVARRFDEIVEFADIAEAIDRQVKFYSSGMRLRLGFAVAAFLEPDVLLVDEVLAVGDATFQQRCLDRIRTVLAQGTTLIFVSHDLAAVESTCRQGIWLRDGVIAESGDMSTVVGGYRAWVDEVAASAQVVEGEVSLLKARVSGTDEGNAIRWGEPVRVEMRLRTDDPRQCSICIGVSEGTAAPTVFARRELSLAAGDTEVRCTLRDLPLPRGRYFLWAGVLDKRRDLLPWHPAASFDLSGPQLPRTPPGIVRLAPVYVDASWEESGP